MTERLDRNTNIHVHIKALRLRTIIGVYEHERHTPQDVVVHVEMAVDAAQAAATDDLQFAVDYAALRDRIAQCVEASKFHLLERLAEEILQIVLDEPRVQSAKVEVEKPNALEQAEAVSVCVTASR